MVNILQIGEHGMASKITLKTQEEIIASMSPAHPSNNTVVDPISVRTGPIIAIQNLSTAISDSQLQATMSALQIQLDRDFLPAWGRTATLVFINKNGSIPTGAWPLYVFDNTDTAGALGYHTETIRGLPFGRVFVKTCIQYGYSWTVTLSHELLEMLVNPNINLTVFNQNSNTTGSIYFYEVGDPVEDDSYGYSINGVLVSDFVYPSWFDPYQTASGTRYDQGNHCTSSFQVLHNGYVSIFYVNRGSGWTMITRDNVEVPSGSNSSGRNRMDR